MAITSQPQRPGYPLTWRVPPGRLPKDSWVKVSQIRLLSTERLGDRLGQFAEHELEQLVGGLLELIG
jgi:mRNA interferase MazF